MAIDGEAKARLVIDSHVCAAKRATSLQRERAIAQAIKDLNGLCENWLNPYKDLWSAGLDATPRKRALSNLDIENPLWLQNAHRKLVLDW